MKKHAFYIFMIVFVSAFAFQSAAAQFPIKIPKINKPKVEQPKTGGNQPGGDATKPEAKTPTKTSNSKRAYEHEKPPAKPVLVKSSLYIQAASHQQYWKMPKERKFSSWVPKIEFNVYVHRDSEGFDYTAEYLNPDGSLWFSEPLRIGTYSADKMIKLSSEYGTTQQMLETKSTNAVGTYGVKITHKNTGETVFQGKFKVGKFQPQDAAKNEFDFFVEHDWMLPFGYVGFHHSALNTDSGGFEIIPSVWMKGDIDDDNLEGRVFYQGKQIASTKDGGSGVNDSGDRASQYGIYVKDTHYWKLWNFQFKNLRVANGGDFNRDYYPEATYADEKPGEYTVKILHKGAEVREMKFTIGADGKLVDGGFGKQIFLPNYKIIVPVKVIGASEKWNQTAWKTDAFYGNPFTGFTVQ